MKTSELIGAALDWAVAKCEFPYASSEDIQVWVQPLPCDDAEDFKFQPSINWAQGGQIIEREGINLDNYAKNPKWSAWTPAPDRESGEAQAYGPTPLIATMRCYVTSKLGDEVELPTELNCI